MHFACARNEADAQQTARQGPVEHRIKVLLGNEQHLHRLIGEPFRKAWAESQRMSTTAPSMEKARIDFDTALTLITGVLERVQVPADEAVVRACVADACRASMRSLEETNLISSTQLNIILEWVMRCLVEHIVSRDLHAFYHRKFLVGFDYDTNWSSSGLHLIGTLVCSTFGSLWLDAVDAESRRNIGSQPNGRGGRRPSVIKQMKSDESTIAESEGQTVLSIPKHQCRLPPEILSYRLREMIKLPPIPHVVKLRHVYEDFDNIYLVMDKIDHRSTCAVDKMFDGMHTGSIGEKNVRLIVWELLEMLRHAHALGIAHGSLRMSACYMNSSIEMSNLQVIDFGLHELFHPAKALMPAALLTPLDFEGGKPIPAYRRDFVCVAEMTYLLLGGGPICSLDLTSAERAHFFGRSCVSFCDHAFSKTSAMGKDFVKELLIPKKAEWLRKFAFDETSTYMAHRWNSPEDTPSTPVAEETHSFEIMRRYDKWRSTLSQRAVVVKFIADNVPLKSMGRIRESVLAQLDDFGLISWNAVARALQNEMPAGCELARIASKAFGEDPEINSINFGDFLRTIVDWRRKRVREVLWQIFYDNDAGDGVLDVTDCREALGEAVQQTWSRPKTCLEVLFPIARDEEVSVQSEGPELFGKLAQQQQQQQQQQPQHYDKFLKDLPVDQAGYVHFFDLVQKTDGHAISELASNRFPPASAR